MPVSNEKAKKGIRARQDAIATLISTHREEFDRLVERNRVAAGLTRRSSGESPAEIRAKIERAEERLRKWREDLGESA